jgi:hypothetical protein
VAHCYICVECVAVCNIEEPTTPDGGSLLVLIGDAIVTYDANGNLKKDPAYAYISNERDSAEVTGAPPAFAARAVASREFHPGFARTHRPANGTFSDVHGSGVPAAIDPRITQ